MTLVYHLSLSLQCSLSMPKVTATIFVVQLLPSLKMKSFLFFHKLQHVTAKKKFHSPPSAPCSFRKIIITCCMNICSNIVATQSIEPASSNIPLLQLSPFVSERLLSNMELLYMLRPMNPFKFDPLELLTSVSNRKISHLVTISKTLYHLLLWLKVVATQFEAALAKLVQFQLPLISIMSMTLTSSFTGSMMLERANYGDHLPFPMDQYIPSSTSFQTLERNEHLVLVWMDGKMRLI